MRDNPGFPQDAEPTNEGSMATTAPPMSPWTPRLYRAFQGRDGRLLLALVVLLICEPLITQGPAWSILTAAVWNAVLLSALFSANGRRTSYLFGLSVAVADFFIHPLAAYGVAPRLIHVHSFLVFVTMLYSTVWSLGDILQVPQVTTRTLQKAVCVYILLGMVWLHLNQEYAVHHN